MRTYEDYAQLQQLMRSAHAMSEPAEAHGALSGALCAARDYQIDDWLTELLPEGVAADGTRESLRVVFEHTVRNLASVEGAFELLLPAEGQPLAERTAALAAWCNGYLYGLGSGGAGDPARLPGEAGEFVRDVAEIARASIDEREGEEVNEQALTELVEFLRVGVQVVFEELAALRELPRPASAPLH